MVVKRVLDTNAILYLLGVGRRITSHLPNILFPSYPKWSCFHILR